LAADLPEDTDGLDETVPPEDGERDAEQ
jgi:hypothetical protein